MIMHVSKPLLICALLFASIRLMAQAPTHDPSHLMKDGDRYWHFSTGDGIAALSAADAEFKHWQLEPSAFGATWPAWINTYVPDFAGHFWAPSCIFMNNKYYLFYACSTFGSSQSAIGVATSPSLNKQQWTDLGMVLNSSSSGNYKTTVNAIDPEVFKDDDGKVYLTYGSWFGGIAIVQIDSVTAKPIGNITKVAGGDHQSYEAAYLMKHDGYYYLFINRGACCNGVNSTYYIIVGRSSKVTGPYTGWKTFLETDNRYIGPGHFGYNQGRLTYHIYDRDDGGASKLVNTTLSWENGWPVADAVSQKPTGVAIPDGSYRILAYDASKVIGVAGDAPASGANVILRNYTSDDIAGRSWTITNVNLNEYQIAPKNHPTLGFDLYNWGINNAANIWLYNYWGGQCQKWTFMDMGEDHYQIRSAYTNKPIQVIGSQTSGSNIAQMAYKPNENNQVFKLEDTHDANTRYPAILDYSAYQSGNPPKNILDGDRSDHSKWAAENFSQYLLIDYGEIKKISGTRVYTYQNRAYQFTIELDTTLAFSRPYWIDRSKNSDTGQPISDNFEAVSARYARITVSGAANYTGNLASINEFEIIEEDPVANQVPTFDHDLIQLYPNPTKDVLHVNTHINKPASDKLKAIVYNSLGQIVYNQYVDAASFQINTSDFENGIYVLIIRENQAIMLREKVVIK